MGCVESTPASGDKQAPAAGGAAAAKKKDKGKKRPLALEEGLTTAALTMGTLHDVMLPHNKPIEEALIAAREELARARTRSIWDYYSPDTDVIGRGAFAKVFKAKRMSDGLPVAIKVINRDNSHFDRQKSAMVTKIACMRTLQGHPNMLKLHEIFEDAEGYHVVVEYLGGGAIFDQIVKKGHFSEHDAAVVMKQLLKFVVYMHQHNIVHRDIKPENLMLLDDTDSSSSSSSNGEPGVGENGAANGASANGKPVDHSEIKVATAPSSPSKVRGGGPAEEEEEDEEEDDEDDEEGDAKFKVPPGLRLKVIDYGTAQFCEPGQHLEAKIGTPGYVAPEVLQKSYDTESDVWSAGVVMYILLCGRPPFKGRSDTTTLANVKAGVYNLDGDGWDGVSHSATDMLSRMLCVDSVKRWSPEQLLQHPWFEEALNAPPRPLHGFIDRLHNFNHSCRMRRLAIKVLTNQVTSHEVEKLKAIFKQIDADGDGLINGAALAKGLETIGFGLTQDDLHEFLHVCKVDRHSAAIDVDEFIAALCDGRLLAQRNEQAVVNEFASLDVDKDGVISAQDLVDASKKGALPGLTGGEALSLVEAQEIIDEVLPEGAGSIKEDSAVGSGSTSARGLGLLEFQQLLTTGRANGSSRPNTGGGNGRKSVDRRKSQDAKTHARMAATNGNGSGNGTPRTALSGGASTNGTNTPKAVTPEVVAA